MTPQQIMVVLRRAGLRIVSGDKRAGHNSRSRRKSLKSLDLKVDHSISYQTLPNSDKLNIKSPIESLPEIIGHFEKLKDGHSIANKQVLVVNPISNAPTLEVPDSQDIPNDYEFEIFRLRRRVMELESAIQDRDDKIRSAIGAIEDELLFWRTGMLDHVWETRGQIQKRIVRLESALGRIKEIQASHNPPLEIPERWRRSE